MLHGLVTRITRWVAGSLRKRTAVSSERAWFTWPHSVQAIGTLSWRFIVLIFSPRNRFPSTFVNSETTMGMSGTTTGLRFATALSTQPDSEKAIAEVCNAAREQLGCRAHLALLFVSHHHSGCFATVAEEVSSAIGTEALLGCTAESIVGGGLEVEGKPALVLWLAHLPDVTVTPMHLQSEETAEGGT